MAKSCCAFDVLAMVPLKKGHSGTVKRCKKRFCQCLPLVFGFSVLFGGPVSRLKSGIFSLD